MSVVAGQTRRRWAVVAAGIVLLVLAPPTASTLVNSVRTWAAGGTSQGLDTRATLEAALASTGVAHVGLAESRGGLAVPDLPRFGDVADRFGERTRLRIWWASPEAWRVDTPTATGEQGVYGGQAIVVWDYEENRLVDLVGDPPLRLPRPDDLPPPQATRRLLAGVGPTDRVEALAPSWVAGRRASGLRIVPSDPRSTIGSIDVRLDAGTYLPLALTVRDAGGQTALDTRFLEIDLRVPDPATVRAPSAPGIPRQAETAPDIVTRIDLQGPWQLPDRLAGLGASEPIVGGAATYGAGLVRFVVLPLPSRLGARVLDAVRAAPPVPVPAGQARLVAAGPVGVLAVRGADGEHTYLISGLVTTDLLGDAARTLLADPPPPRAS